MVKTIAKNALSILPNEGALIKASVRRLCVHKELALSRLSRYLTRTTLPHPLAVFWIAPDRIEFHTSLRNESSDWEDWVFDQQRNINAVQTGEWDAPQHRVDEMRVCRAVADRLRNGASWRVSEYYQVAVRQIASGKTLWGCADRASFDRHCDRIDRLIESIETRGYLETESLDRHSGIESPLGHKEILVNISREGYPLFQDGRHRLAIARALGLKEIPVQILVRHAQWQVFREFVHRMARGAGGASKKGCLYQAPIHFDLADVPSEHSCADRWNAIAARTPAARGIVLDIGCNLGFFCHRLEGLGYSCFGVEYLPQIAHAAQKVASAEKRRFKVITGDILAEDTLDEIGTTNFSIVLALNIFHHFTKTQADYVKLRKLIGRLRIGTLFFEPHLPNEPQMQGAFANPSPEEFVRLMRDWGNFQFAEPIHNAADGRTLFMLHGQRS